MTNKPKLYFLVGLPASGKSTYAEKLAKERNCNIHSSDEIRREISDVNDQTQNSNVFNILHSRIKEDLRNNKNVIYDATNMSRKLRMAFLHEISNIECEKICLLIATPYEVCIDNDNNRERKVGKQVIDKMIKNFNTPCMQEGWDKIRIKFYDGENKYEKNYLDLWIDYINYDQESKHHKLTLGSHMIKAAEYFEEPYKSKGYFSELYTAARYHDCGKPLCKAFVNGKGEEVDSATYYGHDNVSAYMCLDIVNKYECFSEEEMLEISLLINYHMKPYTDWKQSEKAMNKAKKFLGEDIFTKIQLLHQADVYAH